MNALPTTVQILGNPNAEARVELEARLGPRSFAAFFRMAWSSIDPAFLLWNWHIDLLCREMELAARRVNQEIVCCVPPRSLKSQILSVAFPAWVWTWHPSAKFITGSNELTLATRDAVKTRRLVESEWYQRRWGPLSRYLEPLSDGTPHPGVALAGDQNNKTYYETSAGGHRFCCTPGSNVTGHGGDYVTVDDPHPTQKAESEAERNKVLLWWNEAIPTRLNEPDRGVKIVIQQRVHVSDLAGSCIEKGYHKVVLPMEYEPDHPDRHPHDKRTQPNELLHPERVTPSALAKLKSALGTYGTAGQLQQRPSPRGGGVFPIEMITIVDAVPAEAMRNRVRRWDLAATVPEQGTDPDYTAGVRMGRMDDGRIFIDDVRHFRSGPAQVEQAIKAIASVDGQDCRIILPQDPGQAGKAQVRYMVARFAPYPVETVLESGDKADRARSFIAQVEAGNVYLLRGSWNKAFLDELETFPNGAHDDQVDAAVGAFLALMGGTDGMLEFMRRQMDALAEG
jgi:predicted phage terminase large subunit-like protein